jgi:hypothetical protein
MKMRRNLRADSPSMSNFILNCSKRDLGGKRDLGEGTQWGNHG